MNKTAKIFAWITGILFLCGLICKIQHWPTANIQLILAAFLYIFFYLPLWLSAKLKQKEFKFFYWAQFLVLAFFMLTAIFKIQHWPGSKFIFLAGVLILVALFIPALLYKNKRSGGSNSDGVHFTLLIVIFLGVFFMYQSGQVSTSLFNSMSMGGERMEASLKKLEIKSDKLYQSLELLKDKEINPNYKKALVLKQLTDSAERYIKHLKAFLISEVDEISITQADTTKIEYVLGKLNYDIPTRILIGDNESRPKSGINSAAELKTKIELFRDSAIRLIDNEQREIIKQGVNLSTDKVYDSEVEKELPWETYTFYHIPLSAVLTTLSSLEYEVKNAETQILTNLLNNAAANDKSNLAAQIAELGVKYESQKKEQQLVLMQKDKELFDAKIRDKQDSVDSLQNTITYFILAIVAFVIMLFYIIRSNLVRKKLNKELTEQKEVIEKQKVEADEQRALVEEKQHEIIDSITYAKRLQQAILPSLAAVKEHLPNSFVYYQPKDIVAGDFYWMHTTKEAVFIAAADCTGHGVPGAMVSVVCSNALNRAVNEFNLADTGLILDKTRELVIETFEKSDAEVKDGMDISLMRIENLTGEKQIQWSGANNSLWYVLNNELIEVKADKQPIGKYSEAKPFTTNNLTFNELVTFYLFSDGYADQFSPDDKKLMKKKFKDIVLSIQSLPMAEQKNYLEKYHDDWKANMEQTDDVLVIGIKI